MEFSEDEDVLPDKPTFTGLFSPSLFKALLHKAIATTQLASSKTSSDQVEGTNPQGALSAVPKADQQFIPCPQLFTETVQRVSAWFFAGSQWSGQKIVLLCASASGSACLTIGRHADCGLNLLHSSF